MKVTIMRPTFLPHPFHETSLLRTFRSIFCSSKHTLLRNPAYGVRILHVLHSFRPLRANDIDE